MATVHVPGIPSFGVFGHVTAKTRFNLALHHLFSACKAASRVRASETANAGQPFGEFWEDILHDSLTVAALTVACLESYANEFYFEGSALARDLPPNAADLVASIVDRENVLSKYDVAVAIRTGKRLDLGRPHVQNADALIKLRNALLHFRPEWFGEQDKHKSLSKLLAYKFDPSPFLTGEGLFPRAWASASFSEWAVRSTIAFLDQFCSDADLTNPTLQFMDRIRRHSGIAL
jgi:hypothetical protein